MSDDKFIENFPYTPEPFSLALLGDKLLKPGEGGEVATAEALGSVDVLGLYFSAHWCPPCRGFTPVLSKKYIALKEAGKSFEILFVSSDRDEAAFTEYANSMTFPALPFAERDAKAKLSKIFKVNGIPSLCFVDAKTGQLITDEGRGGVTSDTFIEDFPYHPKPVNDLGTTTSGINDSVALIVLCEAAGKATQDGITDMLTPIAEAELAKPESDQVVSKFFTGKGGGPLGRIRSMFGLPAVVSAHEHPLQKSDKTSGWGCDGCGCSGEGKDRYRCTEGCDFDYCGACHTKSTENKGDGDVPCMIIIDLDDSGAFYPCPKDLSEVTKDNVLAFMRGLKDGTLKKMNLG